MIYAVAAIVAALVFGLSVNYWRAAVKVALVLLVLEGVLRRWVLPQASELIYFAKDGVLLGAYVGCFLVGRREPRWVPFALGFPVGCAALLVIMQVFNPTLNSVVVGLLGFKSYLLYVPLCFTLPFVFRTPAELQRFMDWYLLLAIPACVLGIVQFFSPADSAINSYATSANAILGGDERTAEVFGEEGNVRITGPFPFLWGYSTYLTVCFPLVLVMLVHQRAKAWMIAGVVEMVLIVANMLMTGARSLILSTALTVGAFGFFAMFERNRNKKIFPVLIVAAVLCTAVISIWFREPVSAFFSRTENTEDSLVLRTLSPVFLEPWGYLDVAGIGGFGPASTQQAGYILRTTFGLGFPLAFAPQAEGEPLRILLELGIAGWLLWMVVRIAVVYCLFATINRLRSPLLRQLALTACVIDGLWLLTNSPVFNPTAGVFYWFFAGFVFLPQLEGLPKARKRPKKADKPLPATASDPVLAVASAPDDRTLPAG